MTMVGFGWPLRRDELNPQKQYPGNIVMMMPHGRLLPCLSMAVCLLSLPKARALCESHQHPAIYESRIGNQHPQLYENHSIDTIHPDHPGRQQHG